MHKLNDTIIKNAKSKSSDYRLTDGNGLAVIVRKMETNIGNLDTIFIQKEKEKKKYIL